VGQRIIAAGDEIRDVPRLVSHGPPRSPALTC
jgi:hypothetical protein